jgi:hypothetical protein
MQMEPRINSTATTKQRTAHQQPTQHQLRFIYYPRYTVDLPKHRSAVINYLCKDKCE